jgi:hypothetical protein
LSLSYKLQHYNLDSMELQLEQWQTLRCEVIICMLAKKHLSVSLSHNILLLFQHFHITKFMLKTANIFTTVRLYWAIFPLKLDVWTYYIQNGKESAWNNW